jgi:hypothetical protein
MANISSTVLSGKADGGYRSAFYRDAKGTMRKCEVISGPVGGPFTIYVPSLKPAGIATAAKLGCCSAPTAPRPTACSARRCSHDPLRGRHAPGHPGWPPPLTETDRAIAHGKLLLKALYEPNLRKRSAARRTILLLLGIADGTYDGA